MALLKGIGLSSEYHTKSWFIFHDRCIGKDFEEVKTGKIWTKIQLFYKHAGYDECNWHIFEKLIKNRHPDYKMVDKEDYRDGKYIGEYEGDTLNRVFKLCPKDNPATRKGKKKRYD
jgi:hypothetical protein